LERADGGEIADRLRALHDTLRANEDETKTCREFTVEGIGKHNGYASG
jgi:hypothetical protein